MSSREKEALSILIWREFVHSMMCITNMLNNAHFHFSIGLLIYIILISKVHLLMLTNCTFLKIGTFSVIRRVISQDLPKITHSSLSVINILIVKNIVKCLRSK